ncbi:MAG: hypothetical protein QM750_31895 [Rubrivivax sp.]
MARIVRSCLLAVTLLPATAPAQDLDALSRQPGVPEAMGRDLRALGGYYGQVERRVKAAPAAAERDPFQVTPELRIRKRLRDGTMPAPASALSPLGSLAGAASDDWLVQGLMLGPRPLAVLVKDAAGREQRPRGEAGAGSAARAAAQGQRRFVRIGDTLDMPDGRNWRVIAIDREGVLVQGDGAELDTLRIR